MFLKIKGGLFSRKFLLRVQTFCPLSWKYFYASLLPANGRIYITRVLLEEGDKQAVKTWRPFYLFIFLLPFLLGARLLLRYFPQISLCVFLLLGRTLWGRYAAWSNKACTSACIGRTMCSLLPRHVCKVQRACPAGSSQTLRTGNRSFAPCVSYLFLFYFYFIFLL